MMLEVVQEQQLQVCHELGVVKDDSCTPGGKIVFDTKVRIPGTGSSMGNIRSI